MQHQFHHRALIACLTVLAVTHSAASACTILTAARGGEVLVGNNEDFIKPGVIWFVPAGPKRYGRVNVGFDDHFAQGSMNEKGLVFDSTALPKMPWVADPAMESPDNLLEKIMNECATVDEALAYFKRFNCRHLANAQFLLADASGASVVVAWLPGSGLSVVRMTGDYQITTNTRLEASGFRCQRFVKAEQVLRSGANAPLAQTVADALSAVHQRGPGGFTSYSNIYDLKRRTVTLFNLANYDEAITFDLESELRKGPHTLVMKRLFEHSPSLAAIRSGTQRVEFDTRITLERDRLRRFAGEYHPTDNPNVRFTVAQSGDGLIVNNPGQPVAEMYPEGETLFRFKRSGAQVTFTEKNGVVTGLILHKGRDLHATRAIPTANE